MFVRAIKNNKGDPHTYFCALVQSYRDQTETPKHRVLINFGLVPADSIPFLKSAFSKISLNLSMKKNSVVKISAISQLLFDFNSYIQSDLIQSITGKRKQDFTRNRNMMILKLMQKFYFSIL